MDWKNMLKKSAKGGLLVAGATWAVAYAVKALNIPTVEFRASVVDVRAQITGQGSAPAFGQYMLNLFKGYIPADLAGYIYLIIGSIGIVFLGMLLMNLFGNTLSKIHKNNPFKMTALSLALGGIVASLIVTGISKMEIWTVLVAMLVYYILVTLVLFGLYKIKPIENFAK